MKKKINTFITAVITIFLSIVFLTASSQKTQSVPGALPGMLSYVDVLIKKADAEFGLQQSNSIINSCSKIPFMFEGVFRESSGGKPLKGGTVYFADKIFEPDNNNFYGHGVMMDTAIAGHVYKFKMQKPVSFRNALNEKAAAADDVFEDSLYIPQLLKVIWPVADHLSENNIISSATTIRWEPDPKNADKGITISIRYNPESFENGRSKSKKAKGLELLFVVADNGTYTLSPELFKGIPKGAVITLMFTRMNYKLPVDDQNKTYKLYAYNFKYSDYIYR